MSDNEMKPVAQSPNSAKQASVAKGTPPPANMSTMSHEPPVQQYDNGECSLYHHHTVHWFLSSSINALAPVRQASGEPASPVHCWGASPSEYGAQGKEGKCESSILFQCFFFAIDFINASLFRFTCPRMPRMQSTGRVVWRIMRRRSGVERRDIKR